MNLLLGLALVGVAGIFQGTFVLPMTLTRGWKWEHTWAAFSLLGMLVFNWTIGWAAIPHLSEALGATPRGDLEILVLCGACWGAGAILFGLGMERLGMAVGYPIIMGLIMSLGALIPLAQSGAGQLASLPGVLLSLGTVVAVFGIIRCSRASAQKTAAEPGARSGASRANLLIAIFAGVLSCLPNVGLNNAAALTAAARRVGASPAMAGNAAWVVQFTAGFLINFGYCSALILRRGNANLFGREMGRNVGLVALMALLWIGSFYLYGMGASRLGRWGTILGWPLFLTLSIIVGNVCGLWRGEWAKALQSARSNLNQGLVVILLAIGLFALGAACH